MTSPIPKAKAGRPRYAGHPQTFSQLEVLRERTLAFSKAKRARLTIKGYDADWKCFSAWCDRYGLVPLPAADETVASYFTWCLVDGAYRQTTVHRRLAAIRWEHAIRSLPDPIGPLTRSARRGAARELKEQPLRKAALPAELLRQVAQRLIEDGRPRSVQDRAVLVLGFACGFRRSNLMRLHTSELEFVEQGLVVHERSSKTDQEGKGRKIPIFAGLYPETCPIGAVQDWLAIRGDWEGPLFCSFHANSWTDFYRRPLQDHESITRLLKRALRMTGLGREEIRRFSSHSLRAGCVTTAFECGASDTEIMERTGHKTLRIMRKYIRSEKLFPARDPLRQAI